MSDNFKTSIADSKFHRSIEDLYKNRIGALIRFTERHLHCRDIAIDVIHSALTKSIEYFNAHKDKKVSERIVQFLILKECRKENRHYSMEIGHDFGVE